jgi:hypothetical protein
MRTTRLCRPRVILSVLVVCSSWRFFSERAAGQFASDLTGRVIGHVYCMDTNGPARLASVTLQPVPARRAKSDAKDNSEAEETPSVMTDMDGGFAIERVKPGVYYVLADLPGYLNSTSQFTDEELKEPTPELLELMEKSFPRITVDHSHTAHINLQLQRGAAVSGTIRYDDVGPAIGVTIQLMRKDMNSKWRAETPGTVRRMLFGSKTDDRGEYRMSGLRPGEVVVKCTLRQVNLLIQPRSFMGPPLSVVETDEQTVSVYSSGVFREKDAKPIKLTSGTDVTDADIVIPLGKIHHLSGSVISVRDGHTLNGGTIELMYAEGGEKVSEAHIGADGTFQFMLVPEGDYELVTRGAGDGEYGKRGQWKLGQAYEDATQQLNVDRDLAGIVVQTRSKTTTGTGSPQ